MSFVGGAGFGGMLYREKISGRYFLDKGVIMVGGTEMVNKYDFYCEPAGENRRLHIYLPDDYYETDELYPVVYMFDGHNLFFDEDATFGTCQKIREFMDHYKKKLIIVGIECSHTARDVEYCPFSPSPYRNDGSNGGGDEFMQWVTGKLKAHIDSTYRTYPFRECTAVSGSSYGGVMALYAVLEYNEIFSKAAVISPALNSTYTHFKKELSKINMDADTRIYFSWGTKEWGESMDWLGDCIFDLEKDIQNQGCSTYIFRQEGGHHCEASWSEQTETWMNFLWF